MPVFNTKMIKNMTIMCGASLPKKLAAVLNKYENSPEDLSKAGVNYAAKQISGLISHGVDGIHLCTMNKAEQIKQILKLIL
jgi:methylenetetrahydrofolate reductase (NADPH)